MAKIKVVNCTPHAVNLKMENGSYKTIEPSGLVPRVGTEQTEPKWNGSFWATRIVYKMDDILLPEPKQGTIYIVSKLCADAAPHRHDLWFPADLVRDSEGKIIACDSLGRTAR